MKTGLDWFPLEVHLDDKFDLIEAEFGLTGFAIVVKLLQKIYGGEGYYCEWTEEVALLFGRSCGTGGKVVSEIVSASIRRGIFDSEMFDKYRILTSKGIQKRCFEAVNRRKDFEIKNEYLLVPYGKKKKDVNISAENVDISEENADISKQSREEYSRGQYSKAKNSTGGASAPSSFTDNFFEKARKRAEQAMRDSEN